LAGPPQVIILDFSKEFYTPPCVPCFLPSRITLSVIIIYLVSPEFHSLFSFPANRLFQALTDRRSGFPLIYGSFAVCFELSGAYRAGYTVAGASRIVIHQINFSASDAGINVIFIYLALTLLNINYHLYFIGYFAHIMRRYFYTLSYCTNLYRLFCHLPFTHRLTDFLIFGKAFSD